MTARADTPLLRWVESTSAADRVRVALEGFEARTSSVFASLGPAGEEPQRAAIAYLVGGAAILELVRQLVEDGHADREGLRLLGCFLEEYPIARQHLLRQEFEDANQTEAVRSILARARAEARV